MKRLTELIPLFRTERCVFIVDEDDETMECLGRLQDLDPQTPCNALMDVSSLCWLGFRLFSVPKFDTMYTLNDMKDNEENSDNNGSKS